MPWYFTDTMLGAAIAIFGIAVAVMLAFRDRFERNRVEVDATHTGVEWNVGGGKPHRVVLSLLSTGNRGAVVRNIRLVGADGGSYLGYRGSPIRAQPSLPIRLGAPDEVVASLELTDEEEARLARIEVDLLDGTKPIVWPYKRLSGRVSGKATLSGTLTVGPTETVTPSANVEATVKGGRAPLRGASRP
jgi:hypothetical protein